MWVESGDLGEAVDRFAQIPTVKASVRWMTDEVKFPRSDKVRKGKR